MDFLGMMRGAVTEVRNLCAVSMDKTVLFNRDCTLDSPGGLKQNIAGP